MRKGCEEGVRGRGVHLRDDNHSSQESGIVSFKRVSFKITRFPHFFQLVSPAFISVDENIANGNSHWNKQIVGLGVSLRYVMS